MLNKVIKILKHKDREDLASLLQNSYSQIEESNTFGSYLYSIVSTLEIYSPYKDYLELENLTEDDRNLILKSVLEVMPPRAHEIEIKYLRFLTDLDLDLDRDSEIKDSNSIELKKNSSDLGELNFNNLNLGEFWNAFKAYIEELEKSGYLYYHFGDQYDDGGSERYYVNRENLNLRLRQEVGDVSFPFRVIYDLKKILKLIEFFFKYVSLADDSKKARYEYTIRINDIFKNFNIPYRLQSGKVNSINSIVLNRILDLEKLPYLKDDLGLAELLNDSIKYFCEQKSLNINTALEKIANSLERTKTILNREDKKQSIEKTVRMLSTDKRVQEFLNEHLRKLTDFSNNYEIRHKEKRQKKLDSEELKQFLFYEYFNMIRFILLKINPTSFGLE